MAKKKLNVAVVGVTGVVGEAMLECLRKRRFPIDELRVMASHRSAGKQVKWGRRTLTVIEATEESFEDIDIALMAVESEQSEVFSPAAVRAGAVVVDNSSAYRMDPKVPLVVPEVNPGAAAKRPKGIIANPNCSTIIMNVPVWPLHRVNPVKRIIVSTYQAASGAGRPAMEELETQTRNWAAGKPLRPKVFPFPIAMNLFSHNSPIAENGYNKEELKMVNETRKIFGEKKMRVAATCVRLPVLRAHCESINLEFKEAMPEEKVLEVLQKAPGVTVMDDRVANRSPQPSDATGKDEVFVGRIRQDISQRGEKGIEMFVAGDQILKGAALNAVQVAELVADEIA
jgi:aspartate-semialdehyde dehydrogenase